MSRISRRFLLMVVALVLLAGARPAAAQEKSYRAERFDVAVNVEEDGTLAIRETVVFEFIGEPFTFVYRELEAANSGGIRDIEAYRDGSRLPQGSERGQVEISGRNSVRVTWNFVPLMGVHTFELRYRMLNVVQRSEQGDLLRYQPLPDEFEYTIDRSRVEIRYPAAAQPLTAAVITVGNGTLETQPGEIVITASNIAPDRTLIVEQTFAPGSLIAEAPPWQQARAEQNALGPYWAGAALLLAGLGMVLPITWRQKRRVDVATNMPRYTPPSDLPPALAGAVNGTDAAWSNALATLFDLAARDVVVIDALPKRRWFGQDFEIRLLQRPRGLLPHEDALLDMLFDGKKGPTETINFSDLQHVAGTSGWKAYGEAVKQELIARVLWDTANLKPRNRLVAYGLLFMLLLVPLFVLTATVGQERFGMWPLLLAAPIFLVAMAAFILAASVKPLTEQGETLAGEWQRFYTYLRDVTRGRQAVESPDMFERYLPYAASYGLLAQWVKYFEKAGWQQPPAWFRSLPNGDMSDMAIFAIMASNASSSGSSADGGAAGGAAGGGGSGAG